MPARLKRCLDCLVRDTSLCAAMRVDELEELSKIGRRRTIEPGEVISWAGDPNQICANVVSGTIKVTASTEDGREQIVGLLYPGDFLGAPYEEEVRHTAAAASPAEICVFGRAEFERLLIEHPRMERLLLQRTIASLEDARDRMLSLARLDAQERIAGFLIEVAERTLEDAEDGVEIELPLTRGEMADFLGLTIETASRQFTKLKTMGAIDLTRGSRHCTITSFDRLEAASTAA